MTRLTDRLATLRQRGEKALGCYVVAGDPSPRRTVDIVRALDEAGADAIELGIPFSDPLADGPSIQAAAYRALNGGMTVQRAFDTLAEIRAVSESPIRVMAYFNPTLRYRLHPLAHD